MRGVVIRLSISTIRKWEKAPETHKLALLGTSMYGLQVLLRIHCNVTGVIIGVGFFASILIGLQPKNHYRTVWKWIS